MGPLRVRLHRPKKGSPVVVPDFDSIHLRRIVWGGATRWVISGSYEDGRLEVAQQEILERLGKLGPEALASGVTGIDRGIKVPLALSDGRLLDLPESAQARIAFLDGKIKHFQRQLPRQKKGSRRRLETKARIARYHAEKARLVDEFLCQSAAVIANDPSIELAAFEGLKVQNMTRKPKPKFDSATGKYLRNGARAKAGLNRSFLRVAPGKAKQRISQAMTKRGKGFLDVTAAWSSQECSVCHHVDPKSRNGIEFKCAACNEAFHADTNAAKVVKHRAVKAIQGNIVTPKKVKKMVTGRKVGKQRAAVLAGQKVDQGTLGAGPSVLPATVTAGAAERARPKGGMPTGTLRLGERALGAHSHPKGKGRKTEVAKATDAAF